MIVTCNTDPDSMRILPDMTQSTMDKIMLMMAKAGKPMPGWHEQDEILGRELPHFGRFLMDWKPPAWVFSPGDNRFSVRPYHHPTMLEVATEQGVVVNVLEMLREVYDIVCEGDSGKNASTIALAGFVRAPATPQLPETDGHKSYVFRGPIRTLYRIMRELNIPNAARFTTAQISTILGQLASRGFPIRKHVTSHGIQQWEISFDVRLLRNVMMDDSTLSENPLEEAAKHATQE